MIIPDGEDDIVEEGLCSLIIPDEGVTEDDSGAILAGEGEVWLVQHLFQLFPSADL